MEIKIETLTPEDFVTGNDLNRALGVPEGEVLVPLGERLPGHGPIWDKLSELKQSLNGLPDEVGELRMLVMDYQDRLKIMEDDFELSVKGLAQHNKELHQKNNELEQAIEKLRRENEQLNSKPDNLHRPKP